MDPSTLYTGDVRLIALATVQGAPSPPPKQAMGGVRCALQSAATKHMRASGYPTVTLVNEPLNLSEGYDQTFWECMRERVEQGTPAGGTLGRPGTITRVLKSTDSISTVTTFKGILECDHRPSVTDVTIIRKATIYAWMLTLCPTCAPLHNPATHRRCDGCGESGDFLAAFEIAPGTAVVDNICTHCLAELGYSANFHIGEAN